MRLSFAAIAVLCLSCVGAVAAPNAEAASCPDLSQGESAQDCPWAAIARASVQSRAFDLSRSAPGLASQISQDSAQTSLKNLWGKSIGYDELAHGTIVDEAILKALARGLHVEWTGEKILHAGMEHTYGYLFSTLKTPFGYKRARWVSGEIERGFGLPAGILGPYAPQTGGGTFFGNVSYFLGHIAFRGEKNRLRTLALQDGRVAQALRKFDFSSLQTTRIEETLPTLKVRLRTDLVPFIQGDGFLLVYSVVTPKEGSRLVTGFPVDRGFALKLLDPSRLGADPAITTRYNAYVEGVSGKTLPGTRRVVSVLK